MTAKKPSCLQSRLRRCWQHLAERFELRCGYRRFDSLLSPLPIRTRLLDLSPSRLRERYDTRTTILTLLNRHPAMFFQEPHVSADRRLSRSLAFTQLVLGHWAQMTQHLKD